MAVTIDGTTGITTPGVTDTGNLSVAGTTSLTTALPATSGGTGNSVVPGAGTIVYGDGTGYAYLSAGLSNQVLISNGSSAPAWRNQYPAGTATTPPILLASGTNMTSPSAGAIEYDGTAFYGTPITGQRGIIPDAQYFRVNSGVVGANVGTVQSVFGVGVTLSSGTVYAFDALYLFTKTAGVSSHSIGIGFSNTGSINNVAWKSISAFSGAGTLPGGSTATYSAINNSLTSVTATASSATANASAYIAVSGTISINFGGVFTPQYTLSTTPGGAYTTAAGSYFMIYPIGLASATNVSVGTWA